MADENEQSPSAAAEVHRSSPDRSVWYEPERDEVSLVRLLNVVLRHRWKVASVPLVLVAAVFVQILVAAPTYTVEASFMPQSDGGMGQEISRMSGLASQFGVDIPTSGRGQSPQFYADLVMSDRLLEATATTPFLREGQGDRAGDSPGRMRGEFGFDSGNYSDSGVPLGSQIDSAGMTLVDLYGIEAESRRGAVVQAAKKLQEAISVSTNTETGVVELSVKTPWPSVSRQVADRLIDLVNNFNNDVRQSQARHEAEFVATRLEEARAELRSAEDSLQAFLESNVTWEQSPDLRFRHDRLQRRVTLEQQVYTSLATRYEEARIREVKSTPVVTTVTEPGVPPAPDPSRVSLKVSVALILGGLLGTLWAFGIEFTDYVRQENAEDYREFVILRKRAARDVIETGRKIRQMVKGGLSQLED